MAFDIRRCDLEKLNSLTKYPSILTYHELDPQTGNLTDRVTAAFEGEIVATEKVDGTNARIIFFPDKSFLIGSREELLFAKGDLIGNPALGIVAALKEKAHCMVESVTDDAITVFYGEVFGGKVTAASKQYTGQRQVSFRLFDVARINDYNAMLDWNINQISSWREEGMQPFLTEEALGEMARRHGFELTPRITRLMASALPTSISDAFDFLGNAIQTTHCLLDDTGGGQPEGLVLRSLNRSAIAKMRFQDYQRTLKNRKPRA